MKKNGHKFTKCSDEVYQHTHKHHLLGFSCHSPCSQIFQTCRNDPVTMLIKNALPQGLQGVIAVRLQLLFSVFPLF